MRLRRSSSPPAARPAAVAGAVALLLAVAAAAGAVKTGTGHGATRAAAGASSLPEWVGSVVLALVAGLVVLFVYSVRFGGQTGRRQPRVRRGSGSGRRPWWHEVAMFTLLVMLLLGVIAVLGVLVHSAQSVAKPSASCGGGPCSGKGGTLSYTGRTTFHWLSLVVGAGVALVVVAIVSLVARKRHNRALAAMAPDGLAAQRSDAVVALDDSLVALEAEPDPRRAIIAAYARMDRWLGEAGFGREPWEAPFEHLDRVLVGLGATTAVGARLAELFERAKFSAHQCGPSMKQAALDALVELRDDLGREPVGVAT